MGAGDRSVFRRTLIELDELEAAGRAIRVRVAGEERVAAVEDAARLRDEGIRRGPVAPGRQCGGHDWGREGGAGPDRDGVAINVHGDL